MISSLHLAHLRSMRGNRFKNDRSPSRERSPVALQQILLVKRRGRVAVFGVEQVVNADGQIQSLEQLLAEQRQIDDSKGIGLGAEACQPFACVKELCAGKDFLLHQGNTQVELRKMLRRVHT